MPNNQNIICPKCGHDFPIEEVLTKQIEDDYKKKLRDSVDELKSEYDAKEAELKTARADINKRKLEMDAEIDERANKQTAAIEKKAKQKAEKDFENKMNILNQENADMSAKVQNLGRAEAENEKLKRDMKAQADELRAKIQKEHNIQIDKALENERIKTADAVREKTQKEFEIRLKAAKEQNSEQTEKIQKLQETELENEKLKRALDDKEREVELKYERKLSSELNEKAEKIRLSEAEKHELILKDSEEENNKLKLQIEELNRSSKQGSMQAQGENMELLLEENLKEMFPTDKIEEVAKGIKGADVIQTVVSQYGVECGSIVYESKRTKAFKKEWLPKLKSDTVAIKGDVSVLVTQAMPDDVEKIGLVDGVWICSLHDYKGVARLLREGLINIATFNDAQKNKGDKIANLYEYMISTEFKMQLESILSGFHTLKEDHEKEKAAIQRHWKKREKQYDAIFDSTNSFLGSIQGIAGSSIPQLNDIDSAGNLLE